MKSEKQLRDQLRKAGSNYELRLEDVEKFLTEK